MFRRRPRWLLRLRLRLLLIIYPQIRFIRSRPIPKVSFKLCPSLIQRDSMSECFNDGVGRCEGESMGDETDGIYRVPKMSVLAAVDERKKNRNGIVAVDRSG